MKLIQVLLSQLMVRVKKNIPPLGTMMRVKNSYRLAAYHGLTGRVTYNSTNYSQLYIIGTGDIIVISKKDLEKI